VSHINFKEDTLGRRDAVHFTIEIVVYFCFVSRRLFCFFFSKKEEGALSLINERFKYMKNILEQNENE